MASKLLSENQEKSLKRNRQHYAHSDIVLVTCARKPKGPILIPVTGYVQKKWYKGLRNSLPLHANEETQH